MTDKVQKIKDWISKEQDGLMDAQGNFENPSDEGAFHILTNLDYYIDSLQEEPVSEDLEEAAKKWLNPKLDKSYVNYGETKMMELTHFDGYNMLDAIEFGAEWQKKHQAEKDLELTWEDMRELYIIFAEVDTEIELCKTDIKSETLGYYQEVLKRFKEKKGK